MHETPARKIRFLLHTNTMTIQTLAYEIGVTNEMLREVVDEMSVPTPHLLQKISTFFGVRDDYFGEDPHAAPPAAAQARSAVKPPSAAVRPGLKSSAGPAPAASSPTRPAPHPTAPSRVAPARPAPAQAAAPSQPSHRPSMTVRPGAPKRKRKVDLTEVALRQQALLDCLVQRELVFVGDYERRLIELRAKLKDRQKTV